MNGIIMRRCFASRIAIGLALVSTLIVPAMIKPAAALAASAAPASRYFAATGHSVGGGFLRFFDAYGGLRVFGLPLSDEMNEGGRTVQYFERQRFEYHPEAAGTDFEVQLSLLGLEAAEGQVPMGSIAPFASRPGKLFIRETGHSLASPFLEFWQGGGGVRVLGYPVTEPVKQNGLLVQYFERARMEYHPETASKGFGVQLGLLGRDYVIAHPAIALAAAQRNNIESQPVITQQPPVARPLDNFNRELFDRINGARASAGLSPVAYDGQIADMALYRSNDMATRGYFSHDAPDGNTYMALIKRAGMPFKSAGEIIAWNNYPEDQTVAQAFDGFMHSAPHHDIIMTPSFNYAAVGTATDGGGKYYFTMIFVQR